MHRQHSTAPGASGAATLTPHMAVTPPAAPGPPAAASPAGLMTAVTAGPAVPDPRPRRRARGPAPVWIIAAVFVTAELALSDRYGFMQDELYFIVAGHHLAFGYVDQPPLAPLLTRVTGLLGVSPAAIRIAPALAGGAVVVLAARLARLFGAGRFGQILAALATACAPVVYALAHLGITEPLDLLAWAVVLLCVATALAEDRPRWWLGGGAAAGAGLQANNEMLLLLLGLLAGVLLSPHRPVLRTGWPWLGAGIAAAIWAPNVAWQATHGWPQLAMASSLHRGNTSLADYLGGLPAQLVFPGLLAIPLLIAGLVWLWRSPRFRFLAVTSTLIAAWVLAWVPGKEYYSAGTGVALLAAGAVAAERWIARGRRAALKRGLVIAAPLLSMAISLPAVLPVLPATALHDVSGVDTVTTGDSFGWPQFTRLVAAQDAALARAGQRPTSIFTGNYAEAGALDVLGPAGQLPPVLSGHNTFWLWGPGRASDRTVLVVDALPQLRPYFADCRTLTTYQVPDHVASDFSGLPIAVCTGPVAGWPTLWPHLRHDD